MNKLLICFQILLICYLIGFSEASANEVRRKRWFGPGLGWGGLGFGGIGPGSALNFGVAQSAGGIQGRRKRLAVLGGFPGLGFGGLGAGSAFNFGTAQSAGGIQGRRRRRFAANFGTAQSAGGIQG
ncbi:unnamed protein product [Brachionus calyciflorus]|uniref:Uncharacterized protein n=1 Tax=Brachionus calyciflorus TaxID=104777 RepID=A0A814J8T2_9BILA|nr:unnamed protein product [Brachionus calyciflorus]